MKKKKKFWSSENSIWKMWETPLFIDTKGYYEQIFIIINRKCHNPLGLAQIKKEITNDMMGINLICDRSKCSSTFNNFLRLRSY